MAFLTRLFGLLASLALVAAASWLALQSWSDYRALRADAAVLASVRQILLSETERQVKLQSELAALKAPECPPGQTPSTSRIAPSLSLPAGS